MNCPLLLVDDAVLFLFSAVLGTTVFAGTGVSGMRLGVATGSAFNCPGIGGATGVTMVPAGGAAGGCCADSRQRPSRIRGKMNAVKRDMGDDGGACYGKRGSSTSLPSVTRTWFI